MTRTDKLAYSLHRIFGLVGGLFLLMLSLTGCILLFDIVIDGWLNPGLVTVSAPANAARQPYDAAVQTLQRQFPAGGLRNLNLYPAVPNRALRADVNQGRERLWAYVDPYTGHFLGQRNMENAFVRQVRNLHEHLLAPPVGDWILLLVGISFVGSVLTGTWYYRKSLLSVFSVGVRWNKPKRIVYGDLHKYLGVAALLFLLIMGATGTFFHWEKTVDRAFGEGRPRGPRPEPVALTLTTSVDALLAKSSASVPGFVAEVISFPEKPDGPLVVRGNGADANPFYGKFTAATEFDTKTGALTKVFNANNEDAEYKFEHINEELHYGRFGGLVSKTIYFILSLAMTIVTATGLLIWWGKR
ncbi:PepSY-associated TM helix domain-containing protein [Fibrella aquatilis]|uniref:PepSY domain-containing protein n=1 Tax=Fibrella aquatilis TaxID=2817059 RepID=A0A939JXZ2_9BACT|nr:PepSY-associated TM helix domain-containing protein [Fibrella aquatilis]MBO0931539.1 PepSY domain-containing protein [Fibrella aquatilis]